MLQYFKVLRIARVFNVGRQVRPPVKYTIKPKPPRPLPTHTSYTSHSHDPPPSFRQFSSPVVRQTIILVFAVISILYIAASFVNLTENIPFGSTLYFCVVTLATVGYGDITAATTVGRFWVCCLICLSFIWLPYEVNRLTQMLGLRSRFLVSFTPRADK